MRPGIGGKHRGVGRNGVAGACRADTNRTRRCGVASYESGVSHSSRREFGAFQHGARLASSSPRFLCAADKMGCFQFSSSDLAPGAEHDRVSGYHSLFSTYRGDARERHRRSSEVFDALDHLLTPLPSSSAAVHPARGAPQRAAEGRRGVALQHGGMRWEGFACGQICQQCFWGPGRLTMTSDSSGNAPVVAVEKAFCFQRAPVRYAREGTASRRSWIPPAPG